MRNFKVLYKLYVLNNIKSKSFIVTMSIMAFVMIAMSIVGAIVVNKVIDSDNKLEDFNVAIFSTDEDKLEFYATQYSTIEGSSVEKHNNIYDEEELDDISHVIDIDNNVIYATDGIITNSELSALHNAFTLSYYLGDQYEIIRGKDYTPVEIKVLDISFINEDSISIEAGLFSSTGIVFAFIVFFLTLFIVGLIATQITKEKTSNTIELILPNVTTKAHFFAVILYSFTILIIFVAIFNVIGTISFTVFTALTGDKINTIVEAPMNMTDMDISTVAKSAYNSEMIPNEIRGRIIPALLITPIFLIFTILINSSLVAIICSYITDQESAMKLQQPAMWLQILGFYVAMFTFFSPDIAPISSSILAVIPIYSAMSIPTVIATSSQPVIIVSIAAAINILTLVFIYKKGLNLYRDGLLGYSSKKFSFKKFLKKPRKSKKV